MVGLGVGSMRAQRERVFRPYRYQEATYDYSKAFEATNHRGNHETETLAVVTTALVDRDSGDNRAHLALAALWRGWRERKYGTVNVGALKAPQVGEFP